MLPEWFCQMMHACECDRCRKPMGVEDLVDVGVSIPDPQARYDRRPLMIAHLQCRNCGSELRIESSMVKDDLLHLVNEFFDVVEADREATESEPPFKCGCQRVPRSGPFELPKRKKARPAMTPTRRTNHPRSMPTDEEVARFLRRLSKTSMKRDTQSYRHFMQLLGVTPDAQDDASAKPPRDAGPGSGPGPGADPGAGPGAGAGGRGGSS